MPEKKTAFTLSGEGRKFSSVIQRCKEGVNHNRVIYLTFEKGKKKKGA